MKEAALFVLCMCILTAALSFLSYKAGDKAQRFGLGIILLAALASAAYGAISDFSPELTVEQAGASGGFEELTEEAFCQGISLGIAEEFGLESAQIKVAVRDFDYSALKAREIRITLFGKAALADLRGIRGFVVENNFCDGEVFIDFG